MTTQNGADPKPLRPYQEEAVCAVIDGYEDEGMFRGVLELPTGAGKTLIAINIFRRLLCAPDAIGIFVTDRIDLVIKSLDDFLEFFPRSELGMIWQSLKQYDRHRRITIVSKDTLQEPGVLETLISTKGRAFDLVVIDECHGAATEKYMASIGRLLHPYGLLVGMSATPYRSDGVNLLTVFPDGLFKSVDFFELVLEGYLADVLSHNCPTDLDLSEVEVTTIDEWGTATNRAADELPPAIQEKILKSNHYEVGYRNWCKHALGKRTIIFASSVNDCYRWQEYLQEKGYPSAIITSKTPPHIRKEAYTSCKAGETLFLINYRVLTTGFDLREIECIILDSLMNFRGLFIQSVGRGTRICPEIGKTHCVLLNLTGKSHVICSLGMLIGKEMAPGASLKKALKEKLVEEIADVEALLGEKEPYVPTYDIHLDIAHLKSRIHDVFAGQGWVQNTRTGVYTRKCPPEVGGYLQVEGGLGLGGYTASHIYPTTGMKKSITNTKEPVPLRHALAASAREMERMTERLRMQNGTSPNLHTPITDGQLRHLTQMRVPLPKGGKKPDGTMMTQGDYIQIATHLKQYGGAFTKEGGAIGYLESPKGSGIWRVVQWVPTSPSPRPSHATSSSSLHKRKPVL